MNVFTSRPSVTWRRNVVTCETRVYVSGVAMRRACAHACMHVRICMCTRVLMQMEHKGEITKGSTARKPKYGWRPESSSAIRTAAHE